MASACPGKTCQTFSGSWGYHRDEATWEDTVEQLIVMLVDTVSKGGNLLLNVGPTARGTFDGRALDRLNGIGEWMRLHDRAVYGCTEAPKEFAKPENCVLTYNAKAKRMYVHVLNWPLGELHLDGFAGKVEIPRNCSTTRPRSGSCSAPNTRPPSTRWQRTH